MCFATSLTAFLTFSVVAESLVSSCSISSCNASPDERLLPTVDDRDSSLTPLIITNSFRSLSSS